ncbi:hypothetical protein KC959_00650 [Candidatus Saccharibacteria bacterium]|nr:hypothetical protein [Candidatus Saccharibacteria bacterium]
MNKKNKKKLFLVVVSFSVLIISMLALEYLHVTDFYQKKPSANEAITPTINSVNYQPPTEQERQAGDTKKSEIIEQESTQKPSTANIVLVDAAQYDDMIEVRSFVSNLIEDGVCTYVFTKDSYKLTKQTNAVADASSTPCINLSVPRSEFLTSGSWELSITFEGTSAQGILNSTLEIR